MPRIAPSINLDHMQRTELQQLVRAPSAAQSMAVRARIILAAAEQRSNQEIALRLDLPEITVSKWRGRFARLGLEGLRDGQRCGRPAQHGPEVWEKVQRRVCQQPEFQSRWTVRTLARELGLSSTTVIRSWSSPTCNLTVCGPSPSAPIRTSRRSSWISSAST